MRPADDTPTPADATPDALDERERRQSSRRKSPGKKRNRMTAEDVVVESTPLPEPPGATEPT
jgi:hypothetical protein